MKRQPVIEAIIHQLKKVGHILRGCFIVQVDADGTEDATYLDALDGALAAVRSFAPDLLLYLSGADALGDDRLGRLSLTHAGLYERDVRVLDVARSMRLPVAIAIGGGYAEPISLTVDAYLGTFRAARTVYGL